MDPIFIGSIFLFAGNFEPQNFAFCDGRLISIAQNSALFAILGTTYGGDGVRTFALPDLRGRVAVGVGTLPGGQTLAARRGQGTNTVTLTQQNLAAHTHSVSAFNGAGSNSSPAQAVLAETGTSLPPAGPYTQGGPNTTMSRQQRHARGERLPGRHHAADTGLNYIIALYGVFPPRS
jgi:microcystin-dependent protein